MANEHLKKPNIQELSKGIGLLVIIGFSNFSWAAKVKPNFVFRPPPRAGVIAQIDGEEISESELLVRGRLDFYRLEKEKYDLQLRKIRALLSDRLIANEANKNSMAPEEFITKKILGNKVKVSSEEYRKFIGDRHIPEAQIQSNPEIQERIEKYLREKKREEILTDYVAKLSQNKRIELYFQRPNPIDIEVGEGPFFGDKDAKVTIVVFSDFQCPFCSKAASTANDLKKKYGKRIKFVFKHFPLSIHPRARLASEASMCVNEQDTNKFWKMHDYLFKNQDRLDPQNLEVAAHHSGADIKKYKECMGNQKYAERVQKDFEYADKLGIQSTPTFFINGNLLSGAMPLDDFSEIIDEELNRS